MRVHDHDEDPGRQDRATRREELPPGHVLAAAATGRADTLDGPALLGLQRAVGNSGVGAALEEDRSPVHDVIGSGRGAPLAPDVRQDMEARLGADFGDVRVHTDATAHASAEAVHAHAYTVGSDVVFQRDRFDPSSTEGRTTLAHELTHVVQQRNGPVDGTPAAGGISVSDPSDRFEREATANAARAMAEPVAPVAVAVSGPAVQREEVTPEEDEEAPVQMAAVQREGESEDDEGRAM